MSRVLVTGSEGFLGRRVVALLLARGHAVIGFDHPLDILELKQLEQLPQCEMAVHLAAHKHAPYGEDHPAEVADLNIRGTVNVVATVPKVVLASTCKAAAPITCYGASKLIAERIVLNAKGTVVRLVNVLGSSGSVTDIWDQVPEDWPLPVTDTTRMFITPDQAARLLVDALGFVPGKYVPTGYLTLTPAQLAARRHPSRPVGVVPLRRGDRPVERLLNDWEQVGPPTVDGTRRVTDCWERVSHEVAT